jgi:hypothetical protein
MEHELYEWTKQKETAGFNQDFIDEIYDMPKKDFIQNVLNHTLPEMKKIPVPPGTRFPVVISLNENILVRTLTEVPDTFHEWLYLFRFMLQYFTIREMFNIFYIYDLTYGVDEPNAWVDNALEEMYAKEPDAALSDNNVDQSTIKKSNEEFEFNLDWDIEKGNFGYSNTSKLSLFLPEEVGMSKNSFYEESS